MNVCVWCPSDVTDILRASLWSPYDECSGREHTLTLKLCQSHAVVNFRPPPPTRVQYLPCKWYSIWSFRPISRSAQINKLTAMYTFLSNAWLCCSGSRVQLFMLLDEVCDGWFAWFGCSSSGRSRWSVTNDHVVNNHRAGVLLGLRARRSLNWARVAEGGVQLGGDDFPS